MVKLTVVMVGLIDVAVLGRLRRVKSGRMSLGRGVIEHRLEIHG